MKLQALKMVFVVLVVLFLTTVSAGASEKDTIKIGVPGAHSGSLASFGLPTVNAAKIVAEDVNARGGINGKKIELLIEDELCKPEVAVTVAKKLISEKVDVVLGHICSGPTTAALPLYKEQGILVISPSATTPSLTQSGDFPNFFRTVAPDDAQAKVDVDYIIDTLGAKKIALVHDKGDYGKSLVTFAKKIIEESGKAEVVLEEGITPGAVGYSAIVNKIKRSKADVVLFGGYHPEASKIVSTMRKKRLETIFVSADGVRVQSFLDVAGKNAEGVYASCSRDTSKNPMTIEAVETHKKRFGSEPGEFYLNAYSAMLALVDAISKADSVQLVDLQKQLQGNTVETPIGAISFDKRGDATGIGYAVSKVIGGKFVEQN